MRKIKSVDNKVKDKVAELYFTNPEMFGLLLQDLRHIEKDINMMIEKGVLQGVEMIASSTGESSDITQFRKQIEEASDAELKKLEKDYQLRIAGVMIPRIKEKWGIDFRRTYIFVDGKFVWKPIVEEDLLNANGI